MPCPPMAENGVAITVFAGISGMDKASLVDKIIKKSGQEDKILNIDVESVLMRALNCEGISTFLDKPSIKSKFDDIERAFSRIPAMIEDERRSIEHAFLQIHLSYFKNSEILLPPLPTTPLIYIGKGARFAHADNCLYRRCFFRVAKA